MYKKLNFPRTLHEFIGNQKITTVLSMLLENKKSGRTFPDLIFYGPPGLGKTTLAQIIASELHTDFTMILGGQIEIDALEHLLLEGSGILFIDEIHSLSKNISEILYHAIENRIYKVYNDILCEEIDVSIENKIFIGATTDLGQLPKPLIDRFTYRLRLQEYTDEELTKILHLYEDVIHTSVENSGIPLILEASQNTPRLLKGLLYSCDDLRISKRESQITQTTVKELLSLLDIRRGLSHDQQRYLELLMKTRIPKGIDSLSASLGIPKKDIEYLIEPFLLKRGLVERTPRGRLFNRWEFGNDYLSND
jgi:Holliday junction DNA helicase RuvB